MTYRAVLPIDPARVPRGMHMRLRVETDPDGAGCEIAEEHVSSCSAKATVLGDLPMNTIDLLDDEIEWLRARLGEVIEQRRQAKRNEQTARTRELGRLLEKPDAS